jgi:hypothetical protein
MPDRSRNKERDEDMNEAAARILREATGDEDSDIPEDDEEARKAAARLLGRRGGLKGGPARAKKLTKERRSEIARQAAQTRWQKE